MCPIFVVSGFMMVMCLSHTFMRSAKLDFGSGTYMLFMDVGEFFFSDNPSHNCSDPYNSPPVFMCLHTSKAKHTDEPFCCHRLILKMPNTIWCYLIYSPNSSMHFMTHKPNLNVFFSHTISWKIIVFNI